ADAGHGIRQARLELAEDRLAQTRRNAFEANGDHSAQAVARRLGRTDGLRHLRRHRRVRAARGMTVDLRARETGRRPGPHLPALRAPAGDPRLGKLPRKEGFPDRATAPPTARLASAAASPAAVIAMAEALAPDRVGVSGAILCPQFLIVGRALVHVANDGGDG